MNDHNHRKAIAMFKDREAGILEETEKGFKFTYNESFIKNGASISVSMPITKKIHESSKLFPFFEGMLPEGWYLDIVTKKLKIDKNDAFGLLIATSNSTIGAVWIKNI